MTKKCMIKQNFHILKALFTLLELLTVVAVITILASLLLPSLAKARNTAKGILCINNLKQIGLNYEYYTSDFNEWCCPSSLQTTKWCYYFRDNYKMKASLFYCPSSSVQKAVVDRVNISYGIKYRTIGYDIEGSSGQPKAHRRGDISRFGRDSTLFIFADSCPLEENSTFTHAASDEGALIDNWGKVEHFITGTSSYVISTRRHYGANCFFFDGHVSKLPPSELRKTRYYYPLMWNNTGGTLVSD